MIGFSGHQLQAHLWQNPTVEDLMRSLDPAFKKAGSPPAMMAMLPWLQRPGFPVVTLSWELQPWHADGNASDLHHARRNISESEISPPKKAPTVLLRAMQTPISKYLQAPKSCSAAGVCSPSHLPPWWVPLRVNVCAAADQHTSPMCTDDVFEFSTRSATMRLPSGTSSVIGDPSFWGVFIVRYGDATIPTCMCYLTVPYKTPYNNLKWCNTGTHHTRHWGVFIVRYGDAAAWAHRIAAAAADLGTNGRPDYARELAHHVFLLTTMSHDPVTLLSDVINALAPIMASQSHSMSQNGAQTLNLRCVLLSDPSTFCAGRYNQMSPA